MSITNKTQNWLEKNCIQSMNGKTILVTGSTSGVGYKTAEIAASLGANVILACRNPKKGEACRQTLQVEYPDATISVMTLDISDFSSIDAFAENFRAQQVDVDVFVNNAGALHHPGEKTKDGFDLVIGTNYIGVYRLTEKLLPYLKTLPHEVTYINTVSAIIKIAGKIDYNDFFCEKKQGRLKVYGRSKLCLAKYTYDLAKRNEQTNVKILMNHPGATITPLGLNAFGKWANSLAKPFTKVMNSPEKSALSLAYIMSHEDEIGPGSIIGPNKGFGLWGYPEINRVPSRIMDGADELRNFTEDCEPKYT